MIWDRRTARTRGRLRLEPCDVLTLTALLLAVIDALVSTVRMNPTAIRSLALQAASHVLSADTMVSDETSLVRDQFGLTDLP